MVTALEVVKRRDTRTRWRQIWKNAILTTIRRRFEHWISSSDAMMASIILSKPAYESRWTRETKGKICDLTSQESTPFPWNCFLCLQSNMWTSDWSLHHVWTCCWLLCLLEGCHPNTEGLSMMIVIRALMWEGRDLGSGACCKCCLCIYPICIYFCPAVCPNQ